MSIKYIFITGGVVSSLGKGLTAASIALLLEKQGLNVAMLKLDPYLNVDPGTMNPFQHGEVYVTDDGAETDLDLGHYFRYTHSPLSKASNATSGQIYDTVIKRERKGDYLGKTVQVIPHITNEIKSRITQCSQQQPNIDVVFVEIGGTVGDIESLPFLEALRQFKHENHQDSIFIHLTYTPYLSAAGEIKTKPTQHSVQELRSIGIVPNIIVCRGEYELSKELKDKISLFCDVPREAVFDVVDVDDTIYEVPINLNEQNLDGLICNMLNIKKKKIDLKDWKKIVSVVKRPKGSVKVGIVGKYVQHQDAYKSVFESLEHAAISHGFEVEIERIESDKLFEKGAIKKIPKCDGYLIPGGFGERGWEGKIAMAKHCREKDIPYFGICLGMQVMVVEYARNVLGYEDANSTEIDSSTEHPVISLLSEQRTVRNLGGTMRLGAYPCKLKEKSRAAAAYKVSKISERHRHRYEVNNQYVDELEDNGLLFTGIFTKQKLCEIAEVKNHPWMLGAQFHPEFKSKPTCAHPLFGAFVQAMIGKKKKNMRKKNV
ncbi:MAG: CTP synthase [Chlamydiae bacterium]|nr:CTP synthase [Chlamydiota bacterium]